MMGVLRISVSSGQSKIDNEASSSSSSHKHNNNISPANNNILPALTHSINWPLVASSIQTHALHGLPETPVLRCLLKGLHLCSIYRPA